MPHQRGMLVKNSWCGTRPKPHHGCSTPSSSDGTTPQISPTPLPMHRATLVITLMVVAAINTVSAEEQTDGGRSRESRIIRLQPSAFALLPTQILQALQEQGCTIPQSFVDPQPHNVVQGELRRKGHMDWAVLCSRDGHSSILVCGNSSPTCITEISRQSDRIFLQGIGGPLLPRGYVA